MSEKCYKILAADDESSILKAYQALFSRPEITSPLDQILGSAGLGGPAANDAPCLQLTTVSQGIDAVECIRNSVNSNERFSVVLMDVRMPPGIDGIEAAKRIQEIDQELFLIIVTAYSDYSLEMAEGILRGNFTMLRKPFNTDELIDLVHHNVKTWELNQKFAMQFMR